MKWKRNCYWKADVEEAGSLRGGILRRLAFHGGLSVPTVVENFGCCIATARKHLNALVEEGKATFEGIYTRADGVICENYKCVAEVAQEICATL